MAPADKTKPKAYSMAPKIMAFLSPILSAIAPKKGLPNPQARFWIAIAKLNSALGHPNSLAIGIWKTPYDARIEKPTRIMKHPANKTGVIRGFSLLIRLTCGVDNLS